MMKQTKQRYLHVLTELEKAVLEDNIDSLKKLSNLIDSINDATDQITLRDYYDDSNNPVESTNLIILACKHNKVKILEYLFGNDSRILNNLSVDIGRNAVLPGDEDETCHNAFYYAIRSCNVELLDTLISKWPDNYFVVHPEELDAILSRTYEELKLKNVLLSDEIEIFVESKLINLRFFSNTSRQGQNVERIYNIRKRIELILENIKLLKTDCSNTEEINEKFLFVAKSIAQNIHILKWQLKSTYDRLPWEEIEFYLVSFISSHTKQQEINLFYNIILNKSKILNHLENFAKKLEEEKDIVEGLDIGKHVDLSKLDREKVVAEIINSCPQFEELYNDYQQMRDIHSLEKISDYIKLALSADPKKKEGQLIITRVLQIIGEYLKNTLESSKLSHTTSERLLLSLPKNTRQIIKGLRNSLSHPYSLSKRTQIEENTDISFFIGIQNDTKRIDSVITDTLYNNKIKIIRVLLKKIADSESLDEIKKVAKIFSNVELNKMISGNFKIIEHKKLEKLIKELSDNITDKTSYEKMLFNQLNNKINCVETQSDNIKTDYITGFVSLQSLIGLSDNKIDHNIIRVLKISANHILENMTVQIKSHSLEEIVQLIIHISNSLKSRIEHDNLAEVYRLIYEMLYITEFETGDIKWIKELREKLNEKDSFSRTHKQKKTYNITEETYNNQLALKLSELKSILSNNALNDQLIEKLPFYKSDKNLQAVVEMLVLDIMSLLGSSRHLENNQLFLDEYTPLLIGKCLRNHLAHDNALFHVLLSDPSIVVVLNAKKLTEENIMRSKEKIGKLVNNDSFKMREKYEQGLVTIINQERMFIALEEGNLESLKNCLKKGADINARSVNSWTTLHFAAKGSSLEVIRFILDQNLSVNAKDINGQSPLHIAAAYGRKSIVEFFVKEAGLYIDDLNNSGKTPLHIAVQNGHKNTVKVLLKNKANTVIQDTNGLSPLYYAIINNHINIAKFLLKKDINVDINEAVGGLTPLHGAADSGHLELVNFLLQNKANVNVRNDRDCTPLHAAALNGHLEVVNALILKGAYVNSSAMCGFTSLYCAVINGCEKMVNILLKHEANVNAVDTCNNTPLHYAAKDGHEAIVKILLKNKANASVANVTNITPLHLASQNGHLEIVVALLEYDVDICAKDKDNATPLYYAAENGHKEVVELLIKNSAEINAKTNKNVTSLHVAAFKGYEDIIDLLIKNKVEIDTKTYDGITPLHLAAQNGHLGIVVTLLKHGVDICARDKNNTTPLHYASENGHKKIVELLIKNRAEVNVIADNNLTPLHVAALKGYEDIIDLLIKNKAEVDAKTRYDITPLHLAIVGGYKNIVNLFIKNGAQVNIKSNDMTPLICAINYNHREIVEILIAKEVNVNTGDTFITKPLSLAVFAGYRDIVKILLRNKACVNMKGPDNCTLLHLAAERGHKEIVNDLITKKFDVHAITINNITPLYIAAQKGYEEVVEILIEAGRANVNVKSNKGFTPLHIAAISGHANVVKVLLDNKANIDVKDNNNRTPVELAIVHGRLQVFKILLQYKKIDMNAKCIDGWTILHIASQRNNLEMVKYLVDKGSNVNAKNVFGLKPIHIAAKEGNKDTLEFFLNKGLSVNDPDANNQTVLHYAAIKGNLEVVKYLITQSADINAKDAEGLTPLHVAANFGHKDVIEVLLKDGAIYNPVDKFYRRPLEMINDKMTTNDENVINLLESTEKLFEAVKRNNSLEVENYIKAGAVVNAKNVDSGTSLHYAAWKGCDEIVNILLQNKANPNAVNNKGFTPLHYAAKFCHLKVVKILLSNGAIYNAVSDGGKTPSDFTVDKSIINLFKLVNESFKNIKNDNFQVVNDLNKIKDIDTVKAIMRACNTENKTLVVAAMHSNFSKVEQLKQISQDNVPAQMNAALVFLNQSNYQRALSIFTSVFEKRKEILGSDNPSTLDIQTCIAEALHAQGAYQKALNTFEEIFQKQKEVLGLNYKDTLHTRSSIALVLYNQRKDEEALNVYQEVYQKEKEILGPNHLNTLTTQFHMALVLERQGKYKEALNIIRAVFEKRKEILGANDPAVIRVQHTIAIVLTRQGKYEEALKIYEEVFEKNKIVLGIHHFNTLKTLHNIAGVLINQRKYHKALKILQKVLNIQKNVLGANHPDTLSTQYNLANVLFAQGKRISALKVYRENFDQIKAVFGPNHPNVLDILKKIELINLIFKFEGSEASEILQHLQKDINIAASDGDVQALQYLLENGADVNDKDIDGRTPLHYAVNNGQVGVVKILLENGADVTQVTNKGNTPLHTATSKGYIEIVEILLQHVSHDKLSNFINAKTTASGATSLHIAAKNGSLDIIKSLLKRGAIYNIKNNKDRTPLDLSKHQNVNDLLKLVEELFRDAKNGNVEMINKLKAVKSDEFVAVTNACNNKKNTLLQIAVVNRHKNVANKLLEMLKRPDQRCQDVNTEKRVKSLKL